MPRVVVCFSRFVDGGLVCRIPAEAAEVDVLEGLQGVSDESDEPWIPGEPLVTWWSWSEAVASVVGGEY